MQDKFTERVRKVMYLAREEAARLQHDYIGTEHLLLGVVREGEGIAATVLNNLGQLSYGIYMYHFPLLYVVLFILRRSGLPEGDTYNALLYGVTVPATLIVSAVSYRWFESPMLKLKARFTVILSGQPTSTAR